MEYRKPEESKLICLLDSGELVQAVQLAEEELKNNPDYLSYYGHAQAIWRTEVQECGSKQNAADSILEKAIEDFAVSISLNRCFAPAHLLYASLLAIKSQRMLKEKYIEESKKHLTKAINHFQKAEEINPEYAGIILPQLRETKKLLASLQ